MGDHRKGPLPPEKQERMLEALRAGNYIDVAVRFAGISKATYYRWMEEADKPDGEQWQRDLRDAVEEARSEAEVRNIALIQRAARDPRHWTAAAWFLERSYPNRWGRMQRVEMSGPEGGPIQVDSTDLREALLAAFDGLDDEPQPT